MVRGKRQQRHGRHGKAAATACERAQTESTTSIVLGGRGAVRDVLVYCKLASVTGAGWLMALAGEAGGSEWLKVLAELCTALQVTTLFCVNTFLMSPR